VLLTRCSFSLSDSLLGDLQGKMLTTNSITNVKVVRQEDPVTLQTELW